MDKTGRNKKLANARAEVKTLVQRGIFYTCREGAYTQIIEGLEPLYPQKTVKDKEFQSSVKHACHRVREVYKATLKKLNLKEPNQNSESVEISETTHKTKDNQTCADVGPPRKKKISKKPSYFNVSDHVNEQVPFGFNECALQAVDRENKYPCYNCDRPIGRFKGKACIM